MKRMWIAVLLIVATGVMAEEGMWMLDQLDQLDLKSQGCQLSAEQIYNPDGVSLVNAIVWLGGCSASFVSEDGLVLTNHHCAFGSLQRSSSEEHDYVTDGFLAKDKSEELPAIGTDAMVLQEMSDVTKKVLKGTSKIKDVVARDKKIQANIQKIEEKLEKGREDVTARVASMYNGKLYMLYVYKKYQDVRIVFAPPSSIGKYGGDIDNWMWPRHTGDFTYYRVYQAPDGSGRKYNEENIPVHPKNHLKISTGPLNKDDFTFILGFPGRTQRWRTSHSVAWNLEWSYPNRIKNFQQIIDLMDEATKDSKEGQIKVVSRKAMFNNALKNYQGNVDGMTKTHFLDKKRAFEAELMEFLNSNPELSLQYGTVLDDIGALYTELERYKLQDDVLSSFRYMTGTLASTAMKIVNTAEERAKPKSERNPRFSEHGVKQEIERLHLSYFSYYRDVDEALVANFLKKAMSLPEEQKVNAISMLGAENLKDIPAYVSSMFDRTRLEDVEYAKSLYDLSLNELQKLDDPIIQMALAFYDDVDKQNDRAEVFNANIDVLRKKYLDALYAWKGKGLYPDANSTMRFTYGHIAGYSPADAIWYAPQTTLTGVIEKDTGVEPFDVPAKLKELYQEKDFGQWKDEKLQDVPVAFTHRCDITGGNSGSAVMNTRGELIGLAFDGNYEAMTSDWQYDYDMQRSISVDIRYVMFITEKFAGADYLLKEMELK